MFLVPLVVVYVTCGALWIKQMLRELPLYGLLSFEMSLYVCDGCCVCILINLRTGLRLKFAQVICHVKQDILRICVCLCSIWDAVQGIRICLCKCLHLMNYMKTGRIISIIKLALH